jgi:hypothetical protein
VRNKITLQGPKPHSWIINSNKQNIKTRSTFFFSKNHIFLSIGTFLFCFHYQLNLVWESILTSSGSSPLPIAVWGDRTMVLLIKFSANHYWNNYYLTSTWIDKAQTLTLFATFHFLSPLALKPNNVLYPPQLTNTHCYWYTI